MAKRRKTKGIDDEAACSTPESDESSEDEGSETLGGFIVDSDESDFDETELHPLHEDPADTAAPAKAPKKRGRPRGSTLAKSPPPKKPPGDSAYPCNNFSLTVTKTGEDVGLDALESVAQFIEDHCLKGGVSTEVGKRAHNLHLQAVLKMHWPATKEYTTILQKMVKALLPGGGTKYKVLLKLFSKNQTFSAMVGYITKDQGLAHYQICTHNISRAELSYGRRDHDALLTSFDDNKKILNLKNFFNECYKFNMRCMYPAVVPIHYAVLYMIQSGSYILSPDFISVFKKIDLDQAKILWEMTHKPQEAVLNDVLTLLFNPLSYGIKTSDRYFVASLHRLDAEQQERLEVNSSPVPDSPRDVPQPVTTNSSSNSSSGGPMVRVNALLGIARSRVLAPHTPVATQPDYIHLPTEEDEECVSYTLDTTPTPNNATSHVDRRCPDNLDAMLHIVRDLRSARHQAMNTLPNLLTPPQQDHAQKELATSKERANAKTKLSDFYAFE